MINHVWIEDALSWTHNKDQFTRDLEEWAILNLFDIHEYSETLDKMMLFNLETNLNHYIGRISRKYLAAYSTTQIQIFNKDFKIKTILNDIIYFKSVTSHHSVNRKILYFIICKE